MSAFKKNRSYVTIGIIVMLQLVNSDDYDCECRQNTACKIKMSVKEEKSKEILRTSGVF